MGNTFKKKDGRTFKKKDGRERVVFFQSVSPYEVRNVFELFFTRQAQIYRFSKQSTTNMMEFLENKSYEHPDYLGFHTCSIDDTSFKAFIHWGGLEHDHDTVQRVPYPEDWSRELPEGISLGRAGGCSGWDNCRFYDAKELKQPLDLTIYSVPVLVLLFDSTILDMITDPDDKKDFQGMFQVFAENRVGVPIGTDTRGSLILVLYIIYVAFLLSSRFLMPLPASPIPLLHHLIIHHYHIITSLNGELCYRILSLGVCERWRG
jgi:hypothetical protein